MFEINDDALRGEPGVYTHNSVRKDKKDVFPDEYLIEMFKKESGFVASAVEGTQNIIENVAEGVENVVEDVVDFFTGEDD